MKRFSHDTYYLFLLVLMSVSLLLLAVLPAGAERAHPPMGNSVAPLTPMQQGMLTNQTVFSITYQGDWPAEAQAALEYATQVWGHFLHSPVPIKIEAHWEPSTSIATAGPTQYYIIENHWRASAVADRLAGFDLNSSDPDIEMSFNNTIPWYFGTDGRLAETEYDFVTIALHQMAHGLGFLSSMRLDETNSDLGRWGYFNPSENQYVSTPPIFDSYLYNQQNELLIAKYDTAYLTPTAALADELLSSNLRLSLPTTNEPIPLYSEAPFMNGVNLDHLADSFAGGTDRLLTRFISEGQATHRPGPATMQIMESLGWEVNLAPRLVLEKSSLSAEVVAGMPLTVMLQLENLGLNNATDLTISSQLPPELSLVAGSATETGLMTATAQAVHWQVSSLPVDDVAPRSMQLVVSPSLALGERVSMTVAAQSAEGSMVSKTFTIEINTEQTISFIPRQVLDSVNVRDSASGDLNNDGFIDLYLANFAEPDRVYFNQGDGSFLDSGQRLGMGNSTAIALADLTGDGSLDAFVAKSGQPDMVWVNNGRGVFSATTQNFAAANSQDVALADITGDGLPEAVVVRDTSPARQNGSANQILLNDGNGNFSDSGQNLGSGSSQAVAVGDLNGDGEPDMVIINDQNEENQILLNDGNGNFSNSGQNLGPSNSQGVALGDVDGDGDTDAVIANDNNELNQLLLNDGNGNFSDSGQNLGSDNSQSVALEDINGDNSPDAIIGGETGSVLLLNDGAGNFTQNDPVTNSPNTVALTLGDFDNNGQTDVFNTSDSANGSTVLLVVVQEGCTIEMNKPCLLAQTINGLNAQITVPAGALPNGRELQFRTFNSLPADRPWPSGMRFIKQGVVIEMLQAGQPVTETTFSKPFTLSMQYAPEQVKRAEDVRIYYWEPAATQWIAASTTCTPPGVYQYLPAENRVELALCHLTEFALFTRITDAYLPLIVRE